MYWYFQRTEKERACEKEDIARKSKIIIEREKKIIKYFLEILIHMYLVPSIRKLVAISKVCCMVVVPVMSSDFRCSKESGILWNSIGIHKSISKTLRKNSPLRHFINLS